MVLHDMENALLLDHATGSLPQAMDILLAAQVSINPDVRAKYKTLNHIGGILLDSIDEAPVSNKALDHVFEQLDKAPIAQDTRMEPELDETTKQRVPAAIRAYLPGSLDTLKWSRLGSGVKEWRLPLASKDMKASLLDIKPGYAVPVHSHRGREFTLVLDGCYMDGDSIVRAGDMACHDEDTTHQPIADRETGCLCFVVMNAPIKFRGPLGWLINPFLKI